MEEKEVVQEQIPQQVAEEENPLAVIQSSLSRFMEVAESCSKRQLVRVIQALAIHPLNEDDFHLPYPQEKELFELGSKITQAKLALLYVGLQEKKMAEQIAAANADAPTMISDKNEEENTNGEVKEN